MFIWAFMSLSKATMNWKELEKYVLIDWKKAKIKDLSKADRTPQFEQDTNNCWFYSMCNNAYYNLKEFKLWDLIEVRNRMKSDWIKFYLWWNPLVSWWYISKYLSEKLWKNIRCFHISFYDTKELANLLKKWYCLEMERISSPLIYSDNDDDWIINEIHYYSEKTWLHSTNISFDSNKKLFKELGTWGDKSKHNIMYYDLLKFGQCVKTRAIGSEFYFLAELKDE